MFSTPELPGSDSVGMISAPSEGTPNSSNQAAKLEITSELRKFTQIPQSFPHKSVVKPRLFPHKSVVKRQIFPHKSVIKPKLFPHKSVVKPKLFPHKSVKDVAFYADNH